MKLFLIGLMGSGKSALGRKISMSVQLPFIDLDDELEKQEGLPVSKIFATKGKPYFRTVEAAMLRKLSETKEFVMATGGGTPCFHDNMNFINQTGTSIFLDTPIDEIVKRLDKIERMKRPLLESTPNNEVGATLETMLRNRIAFYDQAHFVVNGATAKAWDILQLINTRK